MPSKTQPDKMLPVTFGTHKKQFFCLAPSVRGWFRNHWRKSIGGRFRNTRTAAGFEPMPSKTQPDKMLPVTFGTHKKQFFCLPSVRGWFRNHWRKSLGGRIRNTRTAAGFEPMPSKTQPDKMLPVTFGTHKKQFFCLAPSVRGWFRNHWRKSLGGRFRNTRTAAGFEPMPSKTQPEKMLPVTFGTHKKQLFCLAPLVRGWFRNHWRKSLGGRCRNTRTAAGFEPMPSKTQPDKMLPVTFGTHKKQFFCLAPSVRAWFRNHWRKSLGGRFRNTRTAAGFEPMPSKTQPDKMLPVTFGTHKKQLFCLAPSVRGWFRNHWRQSLGGRF